MSQQSNNSRDLLNDAIREASGAPAHGKPVATANAELQRKLTIAEALQEHQVAPTARSGQRVEQNKGATHSASRWPIDSSHDASLNAVLAEVGPGGTASVATSAAQSAVNLSSATLTEALSGIDTEKPGVTIGAGATRRRISGFAVALILFVGIAGYWWSQQRPNGPAAVLHELADAVEQYRAAHPGTLPVSLAQMRVFPKGAVEWPLRYWKARDAAGRTEITWVPQNGHYRILLRQGADVWTVTDRERAPKLMLKGNP